MQPLRIGINALYLIPGGVGGTEIYFRNLLGALAAIDSSSRYEIFVNRETFATLAAPAPNFRIIDSGVRASFRPARIAWEQTGLPLACRGLDVLFNPGFTAPLLAPCPQVTVFHDLQHKRHPEYFRWFDLPFWNLLLYTSAVRSRLVLADSGATAADLKRFYGLGPERVRVVPLGVNPLYFDLAARRTQPQEYLLAVSTLHPHKNLVRLLRVFSRLRERHPQFRLVIAGMRGFHAAAVEKTRADLGLEQAATITGWIADGDLHELYVNAFAAVYPSTFEGFGLPVLEAMAAGVPLACSDIEPLASIAGDTALRFDPESDDAMLSALERLITDASLRARLAEDAIERARLFTWRKTAELTFAALTEAAKRSL